MIKISDFEIEFCGSKAVAHIVAAVGLLKDIENKLEKNGIRVLNLKDVKEHLGEAYKCLKEE